MNFFKVEPLKKSNAATLENEYHPDERSSKKRKAETPNQKPKPLKKGTTAYHIVKFMESIMAVMNKKMIRKDILLQWYNCKIHHSRFIVDTINSRGYKSLFMPPYSPTPSLFLNPPPLRSVGLKLRRTLDEIRSRKVMN